MKEVIIIEKTKKKKELSEGIANTTALAEMAQALSLIDLARKYMWVIGNADLNAAKKLGLTNIKKY